MTQDVQQYRRPDATPVGHSGTRVVIQERPALTISGWIGVPVVAACVAAAILLAVNKAGALVAVPLVIGVLTASSLVRSSPRELRTSDRPARSHEGHTVLRELRRYGASYRPVVDRAAG